jgi:hypothetical protein
MGNDQYRARLYRQRAEDLVAAAQAMTDGAERTLLFQIAADYHKLAVALEGPAHGDSGPSRDVDTGGVHRPDGADEHAFGAREEPGNHRERETDKQRDADDDR